MADKLTKARRGENMSRIRSRNTSPEMRVRSLLHRLGYRFRLHARELPGKPDVVFRKRKRAIFVHGCFWHQHPGCREGRLPGSNQEYWTPKLEKNVRRDAENLKALREAGWETLVIWECESQTVDELSATLEAFLKD